MSGTTYVRALRERLNIALREVANLTEDYDELKALAEQMAAALSARHCQGCICPNCADACDALDTYRAWEAKQ